jgi:hypothetical protein
MRCILTLLAGSKARYVSSESVVAELHDEALEQASAGFSSFQVNPNTNNYNRFVFGPPPPHPHGILGAW